jgi:hypothetical protein
MQGIIIQGPTNYCKEIIDCYVDIPNVVFSTWNDEPKENIDYLKSKGMDVIQSSKPTFSGYLNINYQTLSTFAGIQYLEDKGITEALKIRSDLQPNNIKLLLEILKNKSISFLSICKPDVRPLYYELEYIHTSFDFPGDFLIYGSISNLKKCFNFQLDQELFIPPEALIAYSYFQNSNLKFKLEYDTFIQNKITFFAQDCLDNKIKINWLKKSKDNNMWENILNHSSDKNLYNY